MDEHWKMLRLNAYVHAVHAMAEGKALVGIMGTVPDLLFHALGIVPIRLYGIDAITLQYSAHSEACDYLRSTDGYARTDKCPFLHSVDLIICDDLCPERVAVLNDLDRDLYLLERNGKSETEQSAAVRDLCAFLEHRYERRLDPEAVYSVMEQWRSCDDALLSIREQRRMDRSDWMRFCYELQFLFQLEEKQSYINEALSENCSKQSDAPDMKYRPMGGAVFHCAPIGSMLTHERSRAQFESQVKRWEENEASEHSDAMKPKGGMEIVDHSSCDPCLPRRIPETDFWNYLQKRWGMSELPMLDYGLSSCPFVKETGNRWNYE